MAKENIRKVKLLKLLELLRQNTDEDHLKTTKLRHIVFLKDQWIMER